MPCRLLGVLLSLALVALLVPADGFGQNPDDQPRQPTPEEQFRMQMEFSFKTRDRNNDGYLDKDEMQADLWANLAKYDLDGDGRINFDEYLEYRLALRFREMSPPDKSREKETERPSSVPLPPASPPRVVIVDDDELDRRPPVYRAGNLPKGMPKWFEKMDMNLDGQIALWEWRKAGKSFKEFALWDRNDDGFITIDEIMSKLERERLLAEKGGKALLVGEGLEFREMMVHGTESTYFVKFEKGKTYQIDMFTESPQPLNPYLIMRGADRKELARDDDSGGNLNARIIYTSLKDRDVFVTATSAAKSGHGDYVLTIREKTPELDAK